MKVGFVHLGCSKNLIDTEITIGMFKKNNFEIVNDETKADIIVINTCGFIDSAKEEAVNTILEMVKYKEKGTCKYLIVMGCLVQRYYEELVKEIPEVDLFIKLEDYDELWEKIENLIERDIVTKSKNTNNIPMLTQEEFLDRLITTTPNYAYLKIGEGCSNRCTYCAIPYIRGPFVSRKKEDILAEAENLAKKGIKELIIIAQDTTKYGMDIYGESKLAEILQEISKIKQIKWIRFLYSYPEGITDELIETVANNPKIVNYFDIPIQHINNKILKTMNRKTSKEGIEELIKKIRNKIPDVTLRTSIMVGFPGETDEQFKELEEFIRDIKFDKLGTFIYSKEDGTPASRLENQIDENTKKIRYNEIMKIQQEISKEKLKEKIGKEFEVLIEGITDDKNYYIGRTSCDAPEVDGLVYAINNQNEDFLNRFVRCYITEVSDYDLIGEIVEDEKKYANIIIRKNAKGVYEYYSNGILIGVYNPKVMKDSKFLEVDIEKLNTLENELSAESKDKIRQTIKDAKEQIEKMTRERIEIEAKENEAIDKYLEEIGVKREKVRIVDLERDKYNEKQEKDRDRFREDEEKQKINQNSRNQTTRENEQLSTKDVNIKQEISLNERADSIQDLRKWLGGKIPSDFDKVAAIPTDDMSKFKDENGKKMDKETTRYSFVVVGKSGKVEPLKKYIPELEQNHSVGNNPRNKEYQINSDGNIEKDAVASEYRIGDKILQIDDDFMDDKEINMTKLGPFSNKKVTREGRDSNATTKPNKEIVEANMDHYGGGVHQTEEGYKEAMEHEKAGDEPKDLTIDEIDGNINTGHQHITQDEFNKYVDEIMKDDEISDSFTRKEVEERLLKNISNNNKDKENIDKEDLEKEPVKSIDEIKEEVQEDLKDDAERIPKRGQR